MTENQYKILTIVLLSLLLIILGVMAVHAQAASTVTAPQSHVQAVQSSSSALGPNYTPQWSNGCVQACDE